MPYVDRDQGGHITGRYERPQHEGQEFVEVAELWVNPVLQKMQLMASALPSREILIARLTWLKTEATEALAVAENENDEPAIVLQTANIAAITTAVNSLVNAFDDPRVVSAVNGAVKQVVKTVYKEIDDAFKAAAPVVHARLKKLDAL